MFNSCHCQYIFIKITFLFTHESHTEPSLRIPTPPAHQSTSHSANCDFNSNSPVLSRLSRLLTSIDTAIDRRWYLPIGPESNWKPQSTLIVIVIVISYLHSWPLVPARWRGRHRSGTANSTRLRSLWRTRSSWRERPTFHRQSSLTKSWTEQLAQLEDDLLDSPRNGNRFEWIMSGSAAVVHCDASSRTNSLSSNNLLSSLMIECN